MIRPTAFFLSLSSLALGLALAGCGPGLASAEGEGEGEGEGEAPIDVGPPPSGYATEPPPSSQGDACSTSQWWALGDRESELMHPGGDCIACHRQRGEGPTYTMAGTVFQGLDDGDDCRGIPQVQIDVLDSAGAVAFSVTSNAAGNFHSTRALPSPYTVRVTYEGRTAEMATPQTDGACNRCHTAAGVEGAPGRVLVP